MKEFKDKKYFFEVLENRKKALGKAVLNKGIINENDDEKTQLKQLSKNKLVLTNLNYDILHVMYSCGFTKEELKQQFNITLDSFIANWDKKIVKIHTGRNQVETDHYYIEYYIRLRWMFSFAILLNIDDEAIMTLIEIVKNDNVKDAFFDFVIASKIDNWDVSDNLSLKKPKNRIVEIIYETDTKKCESLITSYLKKDWHKTYKNYSQYNSHLKADENFYFKGHWAFEVAALVKIKTLDDSTFRDNKYYPDRLI